MLRISIAIFAAAAAIAPPALAAQAAPAQAAEAKSAEQLIRETNVRWLELVRTGDAKGVANLYTTDGALMPPNAPIAIGRTAITEGWRSMMAIPGFGLTFSTDELVVSEAGDMAYDRGTYRFVAAPPSGRIDDVGKYVVVWRNVGGEWQVAADIFNSDSAP